MGSLIQGIGNAFKPVGSLLGIGGDNSRPDYNAPVMDPNLGNAINQIGNNTRGSLYSNDGAGEAGKTATDYANQTMQGINSGAMSPNSQGSLSTAALNTAKAGGPDNGMSGAIANKAAKLYDKNLGAVAKQANFQGALTSVSRANSDADLETNLANAQRGLDTKIGALGVQADASRYAVIDGLFAGAGSFAGMAAAKSRAGGISGGGGPDLGAGTSNVGNYDNALGNYNF